MNPELFTHYGTQIRKKSKRVYRKSLRLVIVSKKTATATIQTTTHYAKEIKQQAKVFRANFNQINKYDQRRTD
jgi:hypothetical protein